MPDNARSAGRSGKVTVVGAGFYGSTTAQRLAEYDVFETVVLTDIVDGHLTIGDRVIPLAGPVRTRLSAWLDHRSRRWPGCINPYLLVSRRTAPRLVPVGHSFPWKGITLRPQALREDRILHEIHATGGDIRRVCDLFGLSVEGATRYLRTIEHPDLAIGLADHDVPHRGSGAHH